MSVEMGIADRARVGDLEIAYTSAGHGAPALLFIHGFAGDRTYFAPQLAHFASSRRVVALDLRGHGESTTMTSATLDDFAADVIAVLDAAGLERTVVCGHSMGGVVALKIAGARPDLVRGVAMIESTVLFPAEVREQASTSFVPALAGEHGREALTAFFTNVILSPLDPPELVDRVLHDVARSSPALAHAFFSDLWTSDYATELAGAQCPLLYVHTQAPADLQRLRRLRPDAFVGEAIGSGHYPQLTVPGQVNAMLDRFLDLIDVRA